MKQRHVHVVGVGKRVLETALPAFQRATESFTIHGVYARSARDIEVGSETYAVRPLDELGAIGAEDLVYLAVGKDAVPKVLAQLAQRADPAADLLIDTPVVRFKHFAHTARLSAFRNVWVPEDCTTLPWYETVRGALQSDGIGRAQEILFDRSAYAYHGVAAAKALLGGRIRSGRRRTLPGAGGERRMSFGSGRHVIVREPRDYSQGHILIRAENGSIGDIASAEANHLKLDVLEEDGLVRGFRAGDLVTHLDDAEAELTAGDAPGSTVTQRMNAMKRVGFLRILRDIAAGRGGYPVEEALEDMVIDYHLEKFRVYIQNPVSNPRYAPARGLLTLISKLLG
ncbi:MAG: hypothetical protein ACI835_005602 [Planctomycetota bacterium]|jgi:hypothetical protein